MSYRKEQLEIKLNNFCKLLKTLIKKVTFILLTVIFIIVLVFSINFVRHIVLGKSSMSKFKNNFYGIPTDKLLQINQGINKRFEILKKWFDDFKTRLFS